MLLMSTRLKPPERIITEAKNGVQNLVTGRVVADGGGVIPLENTPEERTKSEEEEGGHYS